MWTFPINTSSSSSTTDSPSPPSITIAKEVEPTACETECVDQQKSLVACVDSIRAAKLQQAEQRSDGSDDDGTTTSTDTPECLPMAVAAWTKCCEEANLRQREAQKDHEEVVEGDD
mmetsp:Transcript_14209/g.29004  ORF Transcript_14209/g.29004 Transcript_14209/m.29004 type:complete len:116 (-) Transcript_14209:960-1307(-)|eukprot:CAMPEP_0113414250 /NCGR_PEP_ID=MMETSP0013_2-20120614/23906_1 /TAXON_ID=2843 ORGANISM="Skeletonema costatum, Strain 1716" /NCGR_SAMPLE_ID=MMETSP0013_2 /ASSEMBLY_ACC=CAM_ASM_000158 /LENGTH=115 /DNA_ID=CAMNT_0000301073 /DNA_START=145 /DNA_END=492 /DNA_ORIENTATION=+ /assembly_acc=CAM_ASM_000158